MQVHVGFPSRYDGDGDGVQDTVVDKNGKEWALWKQHVTMTGEVFGYGGLKPKGDVFNLIHENQIYSTGQKPKPHKKWEDHPGYDKRSTLLSLCPFNGFLGNKQRRIAVCLVLNPCDADEGCNDAGHVHWWEEDQEWTDEPAGRAWVHTQGVEFFKTK